MQENPTENDQKLQYPFNLPMAMPSITQQPEMIQGYKLQPFMYEPYGQRSKSTMNTITSTSTIPFELPQPNPHDWKYEMRRDAQEIIPNLFLGPFSVAKNESWLREKGITHIVCIRDVSERAIVKPRFPGQVNYFELEVPDNPNSRLIPHFNTVNQFIDNALYQQGGRVLVHGNSGISRSPTFITAFLMEKFQMEYSGAFAIVQARRFCVNPHDSFKAQLKEWQAIYPAKRMLQVNEQRSKRRMSEEVEDRPFQSSRIDPDDTQMA